MFSLLLFLLLSLSYSQTFPTSPRPFNTTQFGSLPLQDLKFQVLPQNSQSQNTSTGFPVQKQQTSSRLVILPPINQILPNSGPITYDGIFGFNRNSPSIIELSYFERSIDGSGNNLKERSYGSSHIALIRKSEQNYADGKQEPNFKRENPREISNKLGSIDKNFQLSKNKVTILFVFFGQFLDHDVSLTEVTTEYMPIKIPVCDPFMDSNCQGQYQIPFNRSHFVQDSNESVREQVNFITSWVDGSQIYGSNPQTSSRLRTFKNGFLKLEDSRLLPKVENDAFDLFDAGDVRANENVVLTSLHTIFAREHNRLARRIRQQQLSLKDQEIFQIARNYLIGILQKITYKDFLPLLLGQQAYDKHIGKYKGYNASVNPNIANEFSTAAFRIGHSLMINKIPLINRYGQIEEVKRLHELFFNPSFLNSESLEKLLRGVSRTLMKEKSQKMINELRNLLIPGPNQRRTNLDLFTLNIQRGFDHGLPSYNKMREAYGIEKVSQFSQIVDDPSLASKLTQIYGSPDNCDPWVCIISEKSSRGGVLGELGGAIVGDQFRRIRDGDRFWYERLNYPLSIQAQIKETYLSDVIMRNTKVSDLQQNVFQYFHD